MKLVQQVFDDSKQRFGAEKIRITLRECGIHVGKKRIREIMQELGLTSVRENAKSSYRNRQEYLKRNLFNLSLKKWEQYSTEKRGLGQVPLALEELQDCIPAAENVEQIADEIALVEILNRFL